MECTRSYCDFWREGIDDEECDDCIGGRYLNEVNIYASTCDGCQELTMHEFMTMDEKTELGYCEKCAIKMGLENTQTI